MCCFKFIIFYAAITSNVFFRNQKMHFFLTVAAFQTPFLIKLVGIDVKLNCFLLQNASVLRIRGNLHAVWAIYFSDFFWQASASLTFSAHWWILLGFGWRTGKTNYLSLAPLPDESSVMYFNHSVMSCPNCFLLCTELLQLSILLWLLSKMYPHLSVSNLQA